MIRNRKILAYSLCASLGLLSTSGGANAACTLAGTWQLFGMQGDTPNIKSTITSLRNGADTGAVAIRSFPATGTPFENGTANVIQCTLTVAAGGSFTGPCDSFGVKAGSSGSATASGHFSLSACNLAGTITFAGEPPAVTIQRGRINSNSTGGAGIATKGAGRVLYFTLVK